MCNYLSITQLAKNVKRFFSQRLTSPWLGRIQPKNQKKHSPRTKALWNV